jgi:hypothetical protein
MMGICCGYTINKYHILSFFVREKKIQYVHLFSF